MSDNKMLTSESSDVNHPANKRSLRHMTRNQSCDVSMGLGPGESKWIIVVAAAGFGVLLENYTRYR